MNIKVQIPIESPKEKVWAIITDIENSALNISGIEEIEILEKPATGFVGLKWKETRTMFGKTATEIMWITEAVENEYYATRAESHGAIYTSKLELVEENDITTLTMEFDGVSTTIIAKILSKLMSKMMKNATLQAMHEDLIDIKMAAEA